MDMTESQVEPDSKSRESSAQVEIFFLIQVFGSAQLQPFWDKSF